MFGKGFYKTVRHSISKFGKRKSDKIVSENEEILFIYVIL